MASEAEIYHELVHNSLQFDLTVQQEQAWNEEVRILKDVMLQLKEGHIALEYYQKNSYRVLLTRARQGYIIYVPKGNPEDVTRNPEYYDQTYNYLKKIGIIEI